jgi:hypothetical protein
LTNAKTLAASNSSPNSPLRVGNLARASVSVSSPRTSGKFKLKCLVLAYTLQFAS